MYSSSGHISYGHTAHMKRKTKAQNEKLVTRELQKTTDTAVVTMDLQVVPWAPEYLSMRAFIKTKLACHDFSYNVLVQFSYKGCYLWHEGKEDVTNTSNNSASCICNKQQPHSTDNHHFILKWLLLPKQKHTGFTLPPSVHRTN